MDLNLPFDPSFFLLYCLLILLSKDMKLYVLPEVYLFFRMTFSQFDWDIIDIEHGISLRCMSWWFDICRRGRMITTITLVNSFITSHNYRFFLWWWWWWWWEHLSDRLSSIQYSMESCSHHAVRYVPRTDSFYNWKLVPFHQLLRTSPTPLPQTVINMLSGSMSWVFLLFIYFILLRCCLVTVVPTFPHCSPLLYLRLHREVSTYSIYLFPLDLFHLV